MPLLPEPNASPIIQFGVPYRGTWRSQAIHDVPTDAVYESMNVYVRKGKLRNRPGLSLLNNTIFNDTVIGGGLAVTPVENRMLAITPSQLYELGPFNDNWVIGTAITFALSNRAVIDIAFFETSGQYVALIASEGYQLKQWLSTTHIASTVTASIGVVPTAKSVCVASRRVVCLVPPHTLMWSSILDHTSYSPLAYTKIAQTNDNGICVKNLSNLSFVCYKERSLYLARAQSGSDASAFSFNEPIIVEGPAGVHAVIAIPNQHIYMTKNGRIALYDGSQRPQWIADGLWLFLQQDIDPQYSYGIFGVYDFRLHTVFFFYPRKADHGTYQGMVVINLPFEGIDIQGTAANTTPRAFLGLCGKPACFAAEMRFASFIDSSIIFTSTERDQQSFILDEGTNNDDGSLFDCWFTTGIQSLPDAKHTNVTVESFFERGGGYGFVNIQPVVSDSLESETGTTPDNLEQMINLEFNPVREYRGFNIPTRFFGLKYSWKSNSTIRYAGSVVYGKGYI